MQMQTGPQPGQRMRSWLGWTGGLELINILILSWAFWIFRSTQPGPWLYSLLGLATLDFLLLQGGLYWLAKRRILIGSRPPSFRRRFLRWLYLANALLLLVFPLAVLLGLIITPRDIHWLDFLFGLGGYLFGVGEFIHYFLFKINMRPRELQTAWRRRSLVRARFWRELKRAKR